jgi:hypothetical protein
MYLQSKPTLSVPEHVTRRQEFLKAFATYLRTAPHEEARDETDATINSLKALFQLQFG